MTKEKFNEIIDPIEKHEDYYDKLCKVVPIDLDSSKCVPMLSFSVIYDALLAESITYYVKCAMAKLLIIVKSCEMKLKNI